MVTEQPEHTQYNNSDRDSFTTGLPVEKNLDATIRGANSWPSRVNTYIRKLFSLNFEKYVIIQVVPVVYTLALIASAVGIGYLCVEAFMHSIWRGLFYTFVAAPLTFIVLASVLRALLEFYRVMFHIAEHMDSLVGIRDTVDALAGISDSIEEISGDFYKLEESVERMSKSVEELSTSMDDIVTVTQRIPFLKGGLRSRRSQHTEPDIFDE